MAEIIWDYRLASNTKPLPADLWDAKYSIVTFDDVIGEWIGKWDPIH